MLIDYACVPTGVSASFACARRCSSANMGGTPFFHSLPAHPTHPGKFMPPHPAHQGERQGDSQKR